MPGSIPYNIAKTSKEISLADFSFADPLTIGFLAIRARCGSVQLINQYGQCSTFLSRIGLYRYANLSDPHRIRARRSNDRTVEIQDADASQDAVYDRLRSLLRRDMSLRTIEQLVAEMISNVENHSESHGVVVGQVIKNRIELAIVDPGIGIHRSLTSAAEYAELSEPDAIRKSLEKGVTNGRGRGIGLWSAFKVLRANGGSLHVGSGNFEFSTISGRVAQVEPWVGTYVKLIYDLTRPVDYLKVTGHGIRREKDDYDLPF